MSRTDVGSSNILKDIPGYTIVTKSFTYLNIYFS